MLGKKSAQQKITDYIKTGKKKCVIFLKKRKNFFIIIATTTTLRRTFTVKYTHFCHNFRLNQNFILTGNHKDFEMCMLCIKFAKFHEILDHTIL